MNPKDSEWGDDLSALADIVMHEKELADLDGDAADAEVRALKRRSGQVANQITCEVERKGNEVHFIVGQGANQTIYKLTPGLAKSIGEELFKQGCNALGAA